MTGADEDRCNEITVVDKDILGLQPGEITCDAQRKYWFIGCPECGVPGGLKHAVDPPGSSRHEVLVSDLGITVQPSILCSCGAHYFIEDSKIRWA